MHCSLNTVLLASLAAVGVVKAVPASITEDKYAQPSSCSIAYPTFIAKINDNTPDQPAVYHNPTVDVAYLPAESSTTGKSQRRDSILQFGELPHGSWGCQLEAYFPVGAWNSQYGNTKVDVYAVDGKVDQSTTWNTAPKSTHLFGTADIVRSDTEVVKVIVNSGACNSNMAFRVTTHGDREGAILFPSETNGVPQGFRLTHNC